ncbi:DNA (cytosine-5-)-methyltransferase [Sphingobium lactosutens]|nr:DNA (cytosine-5-)-methyltransferase [Sphingobium lactosutens]
METAKATPPVYVDAFAGCGGLSLGLDRAGWSGLFAIEKDESAFQTLQENFLGDASRYRYTWPDWLEKKPWTVEALLSEHIEQLRQLSGKVDLLAGGPPCQGFSSAGRRKADDPRNALVERYLELVDVLKPRLILLENVKGFTQDFKANTKNGRSARENVAAQITRRLSASYHVQSILLKASDYGVPQARPRFILVGVRIDSDLSDSPLDLLDQTRDEVLRSLNLPLKSTASDALSDLEIGRNPLINCPDSKGFEAIGYVGPLTPFQRWCRDGSDTPPSSTRLANHRAPIRERFAEIIEMCREQQRSTRSLSQAMRDQFGLKKLATRVLDPKEPSPTVTSMPDDLIHYSEPRTLTVRENARLQTFPDWFKFCGKYTTGGLRRRVEVPRFTQVANAVPPLLAQILGTRLIRHLNRPPMDGQ